MTVLQFYSLLSCWRKMVDVQEWNILLGFDNFTANLIEENGSWALN